MEHLGSRKSNGAPERRVAVETPDSETGCKAANDDFLTPAVRDGMEDVTLMLYRLHKEEEQTSKCERNWIK